MFAINFASSGVSGLALLGPSRRSSTLSLGISFFIILSSPSIYCVGAMLAGGSGHILLLGLEMKMFAAIFHRRPSYLERRWNKRHREQKTKHESRRPT